jgi:hypothetical protein
MVYSKYEFYERLKGVAYVKVGKGMYKIIISPTTYEVWIFTSNNTVERCCDVVDYHITWHYMKHTRRTNDLIVSVLKALKLFDAYMFPMKWELI